MTSVGVADLGHRGSMNESLALMMFGTKRNERFRYLGSFKSIEDHHCYPRKRKVPRCRCALKIGIDSM